MLRLVAPLVVLKLSRAYRLPRRVRADDSWVESIVDAKIYFVEIGWDVEWPG